MDKIRKHILFEGYVQGVGFRYKAYHTANRFGVTGWVRNLDNGDVEMEAEGYREDIDSLLSVLQSHTWSQIVNIRMRNVPTEGGNSFEIR